MSTAYETEAPAAATARSRRPHGLLPAVVGVLALTTVVGACLWWSSRHDGPDITYGSASAMSRAAGCGSSFAAAQAHTVERSTGSCTVDGARVTLVVLPGLDEAYAWFEGAMQANPAGHGIVGDGWVALTDTTTALQTIAGPLTTAAH